LGSNHQEDQLCSITTLIGGTASVSVMPALTLIVADTPGLALLISDDGKDSVHAFTQAWP